MSTELASKTSGLKCEIDKRAKTRATNKSKESSGMLRIPEKEREIKFVQAAAVAREPVRFGR
jgi:hypothetical protein